MDAREFLVELFERLDDVHPLIIIGVVAILIVVVRSMVEVMKTASRERTRREIAAYVAEGSMTPEQAERMLAAGEQHVRRS